MATISDGVVVTFDYVIRTLQGDVLDASSEDEPGRYLHGADNVSPGLEAALSGRQVGDSVGVEVPPDQGFGERVDAPTITVSKDAFEPGMELVEGMQCTADGEDGEPVTLWVVAVTREGVVLDHNHPLAGQVAVYEVTITAIRAATPVEIAQGCPA